MPDETRPAPLTVNPGDPAAFPGPPPAATLLLLACGATAFLAALLLFWVQPLVAKLLLPPLGGSPAVWNTCMVFFQVALLGGYLYAHAGARWLSPRAQAGLHVVLLALAAAALPIALAADLRPPLDEWRLVPWLLAQLAAVSGLPFLVVSGTAPMVQRWFAASDHARGRDPYFLYAASNFGSLAALIGFPLVLEPTLTLGQQGWAWTVAYALLALLAGVAVVSVPARPRNAPPSGPAAAPAPAPTWPQRGLWIALSAVPSSLLLGLTTYVTTDVAAVPLFWVVPLALYLVTFIVAFAERGRRAAALAATLSPLPIIAIALAPLSAYLYEWHVLMALHLAAFTLAALMCHGRLAATRPPAARLTEFYLWIAVGGALGGMFNALAAPLLFTTAAEYPLMIAAVCLLHPGTWPAAKRWAAALVDLALPAAAFAAFVWHEELYARLGVSWADTSEAAALPLVGALTLGLYLVRRRPLGLALGIGLMLLAPGSLTGDAEAVYRERTFFGVLKVEDEDSGLRVLKHGTTLHGAQYLDPEERLRLVGYYHPDGPVGQVLSAIGGSARTREVAIVGLGVGTLACYGQTGERWRFFEIDPAVERLARDPQLFTYLRDCPPDIDVVLGDARLSLARETGARYGVIVLDAFSSDAIPVHLLTREAIAMYFDKLAPDGLLLVHISNRYFDLTRPLARVAANLGLAAIHRDDDEEIEEDDWKSASHWVALARDAAALQFLPDDSAWVTLPPQPGRPWSDDFSNVIEALIR